MHVPGSAPTLLLAASAVFDARQAAPQVGDLLFAGTCAGDDGTHVGERIGPAHVLSRAHHDHLNVLASDAVRADVAE